jgi:hypothetical protein
VAFFPKPRHWIGWTLWSVAQRPPTGWNQGCDPLIMKYVPVHFPFTSKVRDMSDLELHQYFAWFTRTVEERIQQLQEAVRQTDRFNGWHADRTRESLGTLGEWFASRVKTRRRTETELAALRSKISFPIELLESDLTDCTYSICVDVGMYFGIVLIANHLSLEWHQFTDDRKFIDFGQAVIIGFTNAPLNPVRIAIVLARSIVNERHTGARLQELYDTWSGLCREP